MEIPSEQVLNSSNARSVVFVVVSLLELEPGPSLTWQAVASKLCALGLFLARQEANISLQVNNTHFTAALRVLSLDEWMIASA